jgi:predicted alpha/beta-fold hydrolase
VASSLSLWAHAQTVTAALPFARPSLRGVTHELVELPLDDGGVLVAACTFHRGRKPAVVILHGVSGSSEDHYVVRAARALARAGFHVVRMNQRGSGLGMGKARQLGHAGYAEDLAVVVRFLSQRSDVSSVGALGFSLGGHLALSLVADVVDPGLRAVVSVSAPIDLHESTRQFEALRAGRFTGVYERLIVKSLIERGRALKASTPSSPFSLDELARCATIRGFDDVVTVRTHGFRDVDDYYTRASVAPKLARIAVPTLAIHAADDPMVPVHALQRAHDAADRSEAFDVAIIPTGGHVGFVSSFAHLWESSSAVARALEHLRRHLT